MFDRSNTLGIVLLISLVIMIIGGGILVYYLSTPPGPPPPPSPESPRPTPPTESPPRSSTGWMEANGDIPGFDMPGQPTKQANLQACEATCTQDAACHWINFDGSNCWKKQAASPSLSTTSIKLTNGTYKSLANSDIPGFDRPSMPISKTSLSDCNAACSADTNCSWVNFDGTHCWLKSLNTSPQTTNAFKLSAFT